MAAIDELKQAVADMNTGIADDLGALNTSMQAEFQRVMDALNTSSDPAVTAVTDQIRAMQSSLHTGLMQAVDSLNAELPETPPTP
jgi:uncharacterized protein YqgV (UPF0045/DUF77 family)